MRPFPSKKRTCRNYTKRTETLPVYCNCRMPEEGEMVLCERCYEFFHTTVLKSLRKQYCATSSLFVRVANTWFSCANALMLNSVYFVEVLYLYEIVTVFLPGSLSTLLNCL